MGIMTYYCWHCYARNSAERGPCKICGYAIEPPIGVSATDRALWGLQHPDPDVAIIAAKRIGVIGDSYCLPKLRELISSPPDPFVALEALRSLISLSDATAEQPLLDELVASDSFMIRDLARSILCGAGLDGSER